MFTVNLSQQIMKFAYHADYVKWPQGEGRDINPVMGAESCFHLALSLSAIVSIVDARGTKGSSLCQICGGKPEWVQRVKCRCSGAGT